MVRMPGFGLEGPWRDYVGWAMVIEQATGHGQRDRSARAAHASRWARRPGHRHARRGGDPGCARTPRPHGRGAARRGGAARDRREHDRRARRRVVGARRWRCRATATATRTYAPQGVYPCRADGPVPEWVAIDDRRRRRDGAALVAEIGRAEWHRRRRSSRPRDGRRERHDELDAGIAAWTTARGPDEVVDALRPRGIAVATVLQVPAHEHRSAARRPRLLPYRSTTR